MTENCFLTESKCTYFDKVSIYSIPSLLSQQSSKRLLMQGERREGWCCQLMDYEPLLGEEPLGLFMGVYPDGTDWGEKTNSSWAGPFLSPETRHCIRGQRRRRRSSSLHSLFSSSPRHRLKRCLRSMLSGLPCCDGLDAEQWAKANRSTLK